MQTDRKGTTLTITLEGPIGETTPMFALPLEDTKEVVMELNNVTYINSIGVRKWIMWTVKIPKDCKVKLRNCPFVFASQASMVSGFMTPSMTIESLRLPYACEECGYEETYLSSRGTDFEYPAANGGVAKVSIPEKLQCPKCRTDTLEPDFMIEKTFKFLNPT